MSDKVCTWPTCSQGTVKDAEYCFLHQKVYGVKKVHNPMFAAIPKKSEKAIDEDKVYKKWVKEFMSRPENKLCAINSPVCTKEAKVINHKKRRYKDTKMNEAFVEPSCPECNIYIENNDQWARERGHLLSKFN